MKSLINLFLLLILASPVCAQYMASGRISDGLTAENMPGVSITIKGLNKGTQSSTDGSWNLQLHGDQILEFSFLGYEKFEIAVNENQHSKLEIKLKPVSKDLKEIKVKANTNNTKQISSTQSGVITIPVKSVELLPAVAGEKDIIKTLQLLPGIKKGSDGSNGMFVRGGQNDQNLVLLDGATIYNASHLFGFFSVFNSDALKDVSVYKGGFAANYGGRLSSILDINTREGDLNKYHIEGGIGLLGSRISVNGPVKKGRSSVMLSARRTYLDKVYAAVNKNLPYYFYDINFKYYDKIGKNDEVTYSLYKGDDILSLSKSETESLFDFDFGSKLGNIASSMGWKHKFNDKWKMNNTVSFTEFRYDIDAVIDSNSIYTSSKIRDYGFKNEIEYRSGRNQIRFGTEIISHAFTPNVLSAYGAIANALKNNARTINTREYAIFANHEYDLTNRFRLNYGLRTSFADTENKLYKNLEPRLSARYMLSNNSSLKASYSKMYQYMHLVSNSSLALPTDLWYPVSSAIKPQSSDQVSLSYTYDLKKVNTLFTAETYYKKMKNLIEYKEGAVLLLNDNFEKELVHGQGEAYGMELLLSRQSGKLTGWIGYTLSWSTRQFDELNKGKEFFERYDRRHDFSLASAYEITKRIGISAVWVCSSGSRFTALTGQYLMPDPSSTNVEMLPLYTDRNAIKLSASHRLDLNLVIKGNPDRKYKSEWHIGTYNTYNRTQPYKIKIVETEKGYKYQQEGLFGFIPAVTYNFKF